MTCYSVRINSTNLFESKIRTGGMTKSVIKLLRSLIAFDFLLGLLWLARTNFGEEF